MRAMTSHGLAGAWVALIMALSAPAFAGKPVAKREFTGAVNLNTATLAQLDQLPGVGEKAAKRIVEHRAKTPFSRPEELAQVKGFGPKRMKVLRPLVTVAGPTNLQVRNGPPTAEGDASSGRAPSPKH